MKKTKASAVKRHMVTISPSMCKRLDDELAEEFRALAYAPGLYRGRAFMVDVLLGEALEARERKRERKETVAAVAGGGKRK